MPQPNFDQEPAEGSRETVDHELARQNGKDCRTPAKPQDGKPAQPGGKH